MTSPIEYAEEFRRLWADPPANPLTDKEVQIIQDALTALDTLNEKIFAGEENVFVEPCQMFLRAMLGEEGGDRND